MILDGGPLSLLLSEHRSGINFHRDGELSLRGSNLFAGDDMDVFQALLRGEFYISGFQNKDLAQRLQKASRTGLGAAQASAVSRAD